MEGYRKILDRHRANEYSADAKGKLDQCRGIAAAVYGFEKEEW